MGLFDFLGNKKNKEDEALLEEQLEAEKKVRDMAIGDVDDISEVVLASSRADTALRLVMEVRNKFLDAYQTLSRITG